MTSVVIAWAVIALLVGAAVAGSVVGGVKTRNATVLLRGTPSEVLADIRLAISQVRAHSTRQDTPESLTVTFRTTPGWVPLVCIILFPIGLLALMAKNTESSTLIAEPSGPNTRLRISGRFDQVAIGHINAVIDSRS